MRQIVAQYIDMETAHAIKKHKRDNIATNPWERNVNILTEETGEFAKALLDNSTANTLPTREGLLEMREEAIDVASVAVRIIDRIDKEIALGELHKQ